MVLVKTPQFGQSDFMFRCSACNELITSIHDGNVLFDMEKSLQEASRVYFAHKGACTKKAEGIEPLFSKDLSEFVKVLSSQLQSEQSS